MEFMDPPRMPSRNPVLPLLQNFDFGGTLRKVKALNNPRLAM